MEVVSKSVGVRNPSLRDQYIKVKEVASLLGCTADYVYKLNNDPNSCIPKGKKLFGKGRIVWKKDEIMNFISDWNFWNK